MAGEKKDLGIIIGRFQPFHLGHLALFQKALAHAGRLLVLVGSAGTGPGLRNPWTYDERVEMMKSALPGMPVDFCAIKDSDYNFPDWCSWITTAVHGFESDDSRVVLVGHTKDETSFYLEHFPRWKYLEIGIQEGGIGATLLRDAYLESGAPALDGKVPPEVEAFLAAWQDSTGFHWLRDEWQSWNSIRARNSLVWPDGCLHEVVLVIATSHSCLLRLGSEHPGKGLFQLPRTLMETGVDAASWGEDILSVLECTDLIHQAGRQLPAWEFRRGSEDGKGDTKVKVLIFKLENEGDPAKLPGTFWMQFTRLEAQSCKFAGDHGRVIGHCLRKGWIGEPREGGE